MIAITLLAWFATFFCFALLANGHYTDTTWLTAFISCLFTAILCTSFVGLKDKVKQQGEEIEKLKTQLKTIQSQKNADNNDYHN